MIREDEDDRKAKKGAKKTFSKADLPGVMLAEIQKGRKDISHSRVNLKSNAGERRQQCNIVYALNKDKHNQHL